MSTELIFIDRIHRDPAIQSRVSLNPETLADYAEAYRAGAKMPEITLFNDGSKLWLADGWHRVAAAEQVGMPHLMAEVKPGGRREALLRSVGANATHGLRRTNADKKRAVELLLSEPEMVKWSDREIARWCGVSQPFVSSVRASDKRYQSEDRVGSDGRKITVNHWSAWGGEDAFWTLVHRFGLDKNTILEQLQSGAARVADLTVSRQEVWRRLDQLAQQRVEGLFPPDSYVRHHNGRMGKVEQCHPTSVRVRDFVAGLSQTWDIDNITTSTPEAFEVWADAQTAEGKEQARLTEVALREKFPLHSKVLVEGSTIAGTVEDIGGVNRFEGKIKVTRPNPNTPGVNMTHWIDAGKVTLAREAAPETPTTPASTVAQNAPVEQPATAARTPTFADNAPVRVSKTKRVGRVLKTALEAGLREKCHIEFPGVDGKPVYYWYGVDELEAVADGEGEGGHDLPGAMSPMQAAETQKPRTLDEIAPRPWKVVNYDICELEDSAGNWLGRIEHDSTTRQAEDGEIAAFVVRAVNAHREYKNMAVTAIQPFVYRAFDFIEALPDQRKAGGHDSEEIDEALAAVTNIQHWAIAMQKLFVGMKEKISVTPPQTQPAPEAVTP